MANIFNLIKEKYLLLILVLSIFPFYFVKISNSYFSLCFLSVIALSPLISFNIMSSLRKHLFATKTCPTMSFRRAQSLKEKPWCLSDFVTALKFLYIKLLEWRPFLYLLLLFIVILLSSLWAIEFKELIKKLIWIVMVFGLFCHAYKISLIYKELVLKYFTIYYYFLMVMSTAIIIFRFCPNVNLTFLRIYISEICINPNILYDIYHGVHTYNPPAVNNAAGFFANQNVAAAYLGINYFIAGSLYTINNKKRYLVFCTILAIGVFAIGCEGPIIIWLVLNFATVLCLCRKKYSTSTLMWSICLLLITCGIIYPIIHHWVFSLSIVGKLIPSIKSRIEIFSFAYRNFSSHWFLGFGFGGWKNEIVNFKSIYHDDAPHNTLLALWGNCGISAVIIGLFFIHSIIKFGYKLTRTQYINLNRLGYGVILSFLFYFIQGMGDNYGLVGEERMCVILSIFLGYVYAQEKQQPL